MSKKLKRPNHTEEFKQDAVKLVVDQRNSYLEVSRRLKMKREIFKKAAAFFAKESN